MNIVREARDPGDVGQAVEILLRAFSGQENALMGRGYVRALLETSRTEPSRTLLISREAGRVTGFAAGEPFCAQARRYRSLRPAAALALMRRPWLLASSKILRMAAARMNAKPTSHIAPDEWFLALIGVDPQAFRNGIGSMLVSAFETEGIRRGFDRSALFVRASNDEARSMYERCGWHIDWRMRGGRVIYRKSLQETGQTITDVRRTAGAAAPSVAPSLPAP